MKHSIALLVGQHGEHGAQIILLWWGAVTSLLKVSILHAAGSSFLPAGLHSADSSFFVACCSNLKKQHSAPTFCMLQQPKEAVHNGTRPSVQDL